MSNLANPPELIISLSRDKVGLRLLDQPEEGIRGWRSSFQVQGVFLEDQISNALDSALNENPSLIDHFNDVAVVVVDRPNILIPEVYSAQERLSEIAGRYLRIRNGDTLSSDAIYDGMVVAYSLPTGTINVLREYYSNAGHIHLISLLWNAICKISPSGAYEHSRLFYFVTGNTLIIIGETSGKLTFSKNFFIQDKGDLAYYMIACRNMLRPKENWLLTMADEHSLFEMPQEPYFKMHDQLTLPELHILIAEHRTCAS